MYCTFIDSVGRKETLPFRRTFFWFSTLQLYLMRIVHVFFFILFRALCESIDYCSDPNPGVFVIFKNDNLVEKKYTYQFKMNDKEEKSANNYIFLYRANVWVKCYYIICTRYLIWLYALRTIGFIICLAVCSRFTNTNYINYFTKKKNQVPRLLTTLNIVLKGWR